MTITILDGSIGQELVKRSPAEITPFWGTQVMEDAPEILRNVHAEYFKAGATIATTNTYALHHDRFEGSQFEGRLKELTQTACQIAVDARDAHGSGKVGGSIGPLYGSYQPENCPPAAKAAPLIREVAEFQAPFVDFFFLETLSSVDQGRGALMGCQGLGKPVWAAFSVKDEDGTKLRSGEAIEDVLALVEEFKPEALFLNCSTPEAVSQGLSLIKDANIPIGAYANGFTHITDAFAVKLGTVDTLKARDDLDPAAYADFAQDWVNMGATLIGGCCEVGPDHISELAKRFT